MSNAPRATMNKRQRELDQKDRVRAREVRRAERRERSAARAASGEVGPPMGEPMAPLGEFNLEDAITVAPNAGVASPRDRGATKLYVGNLSYDISADELRQVFAEYGEVTDVFMVADRDTGRPRGFAFVTMGSSEAAQKAIAGADGFVIDGRQLRVNEAEDRPRSGPPRGGGGGGRRY